MSESNEKKASQENWRKPVKSIKLVVKKRVRKSEDKSSKILQTRNLNTEDEALPAGQLKRHNPFGCSASKKANITRDGSGNEENVKLFNALEQPVSRNKFSNTTPNEQCQSTIDGFVSDQSDVLGHNLSENTDVSGEDESINVSVKRPFGTKLPADWSLKTRVRFTSSCPFNWCSKMLGKQEARGLCNYVQHQDPNNDDDSTCFQQNIMYWIHPILPWLSLFPRLTSDVKLTSKVPNVAENQDIADALQATWCQSFRSLFNLLRCGNCDYFYLCSAQFTVLFCAAKIGGVASTSAYITPTTKGIREGFDKEGISYSLPVLDLATNISNDNSDDEENDPLKEDVDDNACWLESMGVAKETLPQLQQSKINQQRVKLRNIDHHNSSLAVVTGSHTQALFNYLLNNKTLISKIGSHAGVPPTLLAPVAFEGATLKSLNAKHGMVNLKQGKSLEKKYSLDITGPILPGNFSKLCKLFESTQQHQFSAVLKNLQATAPFNVLPPDIQAQEQSDDEKFFIQPSSLGTTNLTFIKCDDDLYTWETS